MKITLKERIISKYCRFLAYFIVEVSRWIEWVYLRRKYPGCKIFKKGAGLLGKYIVEIEGKKYLMKKSNFLINHRLKMGRLVWLKGEHTLPEKYKYLRMIVETKVFGKYNLCREFCEDYLLYEYIEGTETLTHNNFKEGPIKEIIKSIRKLHRLGYYFKDFSCNNIIVKDGAYYLIDIDRIEPVETEDDKRMDFEKLVSTAPDSELKLLLGRLVRSK